jgi:hypothetical protein
MFLARESERDFSMASNWGEYWRRLESLRPSFASSHFLRARMRRVEQRHSLAIWVTVKPCQKRRKTVKGGAFLMLHSESKALARV